MNTEWEVIEIGGYYRFISHNTKRLTTGFKTEEKLLEYADNIRTDKIVIKLQKERYNAEYANIN